MWRLPRQRKPDGYNLPRRAHNPYKSTYFYRSAPGWLLPSWLLAAQQVERGEPPGPEARIPFSPLPKVLPAAPRDSALALCW